MFWTTTVSREKLGMNLANMLVLDHHFLLSYLPRNNKFVAFAGKLCGFLKKIINFQLFGAILAGLICSLLSFRHTLIFKELF